MEIYRQQKLQQPEQYTSTGCMSTYSPRKAKNDQLKPELIAPLVDCESNQNEKKSNEVTASKHPK
jgi:hypothetical protein